MVRQTGCPINGRLGRFTLIHRDVNDREGPFQGEDGSRPRMLNLRQNDFIGKWNQRVQKSRQVFVLHHPDDHNQPSPVSLVKKTLQMDL